MKTLLATAITIATFLGFVGNVHAAGSLKGGFCYSENPLPNTYGASISCEHIGTVKSVQEIYEKGYRVVNSGSASNANGVQSFYLIIEQRK